MGGLQDWFRANSSNVLAGIVSSLIVLLLQTVSRTMSLVLAAIFVFKWRLRAIWRFRDPKRIYIVSGAVTGVSEQVKAVVLAGPDAEAASALIATVGLLYPEADVRHVYSSTFPRDLWKEHLVVIGGPLNNACSAVLLGHVKDTLHFDGFDLHCGQSMWSAEYDSAERALQDTGAVVRIPNPFDKSKDVMMVLGCDTFGVLAASLVISSRPDAKDARRGLGKRLGWRRYFGMPAFAAIVHCDVLGNDIGAVTLTHSLRIRPTQPIVKVKDASAAK